MYDSIVISFYHRNLWILKNNIVTLYGYDKILQQWGNLEPKVIQFIIFLAVCFVLVLPVTVVTEGKIVCVSDRNGIIKIFVMNADGSDRMLGYD